MISESENKVTELEDQIIEKDDLLEKADKDKLEYERAIEQL